MKSVATVVALLLVAIVVVLWWQDRAGTMTATTFEECAALGNPVAESYPRQCRHMGELFVENIGNWLEKNNLVRLHSPRQNDVVASPLEIRGEARGNWFFEATFPVVITDWDGRIIGETFATAEGEWMTTEFVPFAATLEFAFDESSYSNRGALILQKSNPSGLPEHDDALEIPVRFYK